MDNDYNPTVTDDPARVMHAMWRASCESMPPEQFVRWLDAVRRHVKSGVTIEQHLATLLGQSA